MLQHTFCHIAGIGKKTETKLWENGILSWDKWQGTPPIKLPHSILQEIPYILESSLAALAHNNPSFFTKRLTSSDHWRIFPHFRKDTAYLDIETNGMSHGAEITTIALYDGTDLRFYVNGRNIEDFIEDVSRYKVLVSYNGKSFDIPFLEKFFKIRLDQAQIDLRYVLAKLGFKGGLKGCERQLGLNRGALDGIDGSFAPILWHEYETYNNEKALETLLAYNIEDTVNLERLLVEAYNRNIRNTPFRDVLTLPFPQDVAIPFQPDLPLLDRLKSSFSY